MPLFDYLCQDCSNTSEILVATDSDTPECRNYHSKNLKKLLSPHSSMSGVSKNSMPGSGDTSCCGSSPNQAGCAGPGSCCGKTGV
ncbi:MAG: zinc ribbon domain-containing protein [Deltaproteobacteria bacterium]|nr:zinc ribbon domain-containing protein [Deltaproteobacteria bacterium]